MKVAGFTFIRDAIRYAYPIEEAIRSILPLCDQVYVAVGNCSDATRDLVAGIAPDKVVIIDTVWDDTLREGGRVLAEETNKAFAAVPPEYDWAVYIQGDEVMHEQYLPAVRQAMERYLDDRRVDGLLFHYLHFYGSYDYVGHSGKWYNHEIRVVRNDKSIYSYRDAQGFRKRPDEKLRVKPVEAWIYHYGWVRPPKAMQLKKDHFESLYGQPAPPAALSADDVGEFDYTGIDRLAMFTGTHPLVMQERVSRQNWTFDWDLSIDRRPWKYRLKAWLGKLLGQEPFTYRNYRVI